MGKKREGERGGKNVKLREEKKAVRENRRNVKEKREEKRRNEEKKETHFYDCFPKPKGSVAFFGDLI